MGFFKSQMWQVLEWKDDSSDTIVYRFPMDGKEIMSGSQLTVRESQVAVFVNLGKIADVFGPGKYKLTTENLPILSGIGSIWYKGQSRFKAELYFINTKQFLDRKWGTSSPVTMRDNEFGMIRIRAFGNYAFRVSEPTVFMKEFFGTRGLVSLKDIEGVLSNMLVSQMSDTIAESKISALDMAMNYQEFGSMIQDNARGDFSALGLTITAFTVVNISFPESVEKTIDERTNLGILSGQMGAYTQKKAADALGDAAKNQSGAGTVIGMGLGSFVNGTVAATANSSPVQTKSDGEKFCSECGAKIKANAKFCPECGAKLAANRSVCPSCGKEVSRAAKFCPECGEKLNG
ncbi:MAG: SPFH domain-containing protein [Corallococcus sp.]|nr:SPFH domain-containing protein [Bacillota bacterium]MCM1533395.1 SPFH domain-containing protein [Corallococcus sp.]